MSDEFDGPGLMPATPADSAPSYAGRGLKWGTFKPRSVQQFTYIGDAVETMNEVAAVTHNGRSVCGMPHVETSAAPDQHTPWRLTPDASTNDGPDLCLVRALSAPVSFAPLRVLVKTVRSPGAGPTLEEVAAKLRARGLRITVRRAQPDDASRD